VKDELEAAIEVRKELGADMEPAVIDAFVERIERRLVDRAGEDERALKRKRDSPEGDDAWGDGDLGSPVRDRRDLHRPGRRHRRLRHARRDRDRIEAVGLGGPPVCRLTEVTDRRVAIGARGQDNVP
jgi:hypothetical protein